MRSYTEKIHSREPSHSRQQLHLATALIPAEGRPLFQNLKACLKMAADAWSQATALEQASTIQEQRENPPAFRGPLPTSPPQGDAAVDLRQNSSSLCFFLFLFSCELWDGTKPSRAPAQPPVALPCRHTDLGLLLWLCMELSCAVGSPLVV